MDSDSVLPSSSPAFGTPAHPFRKSKPNAIPPRASVLPILLPPATLRPVAFRTITRKHNLTISSSALQALASFVGKHCGSGWREEGLAERVLDEVAKSWRKTGGGVILEEGKGASLKAILLSIEGNMSGGRIVAGRATAAEQGPPGVGAQHWEGRGSESQSAPGSVLSENVEHEESNLSTHPRHWIKVVEAFDIPRLTYNSDKKYFEITKSKPSLFPPPSHKTALFRDRYNVVFQRLLRNESFQVPSNGPSLRRSSSLYASDQSYKLTPIANLLGRSGTSHLVLGLLATSPTGDLSLTDLTGSIALELTHARMIPDDGAWFAPGMIILVDGIYEEEENIRGSTLGGNSGIGGAIGGRFIGVSICGPPCERREVSLGINNRQSAGEVSASGGLGWIDFLGVGSERARGPRMRQIQSKWLQDTDKGTEIPVRLKIAIMSEVNLDKVRTLDALRKLFGLNSRLSSEERPVVFILIGNFVQKAVINGGSHAGSIEYKEQFDALAVVLSEFPTLLQRSTFVFVPGDNDPWASAFSAGAASAIPRKGVPELFTSRVKRAFTSANSEVHGPHQHEPLGEAIWTSNPSRLTLYGPVHDIAILRDNISGRLRRSAVSTRQEPSSSGVVLHESSSFTADDMGPMAIEDQIDGEAGRAEARSKSTPPAVHMARKLVKTILDQGTMSPFPLSSRPILWDYAASLQLYPLPSSFILADSEAVPFCTTYEGCHVMNPGSMVSEDDLSVRWIEYDVLKNRGKVKEERI